MILLDTCVISEVLKPHPSTAVLNWLDSLPEDRVYLPALVLGELQKGVESLPQGKKRSLLRLWLEQLCQRFQGRILDFDEGKAPAIDSQLAAQTLQHQGILATRNLKDFEFTGAQVLSPWEF